jgi:hypothetical protein
MSRVTPIIQLISLGDDGGDEHQRGPVVDLSHHQTGPHVEADAQDRLVRLRHPRAVERAVAPVVHHLPRSRREEERQVHPGEHEDHEAVERDLAQHERPVVREDLVERVARRARRAEPVVDPPGDAGDDHRPRSQKPGPMGSS